MKQELTQDWQGEPLEQPFTVQYGGRFQLDAPLQAGLIVKQDDAELLEVLLEVEALEPNKGRLVMHVYLKDRTGGESDPSFSYWLDTGEVRV